MTRETPTTKDQILNLLKKHKQLTVADLARQLDITEMAVRRHLNTLQKDSIVSTSLVRQAMGRPTNVYYLTAEGQELFPRNYANVTIDFLKDIEQLGGNDMIDELFARRKERMKAQYEDLIKDSTFEHRLDALAKVQNDHGYMVEWEKEGDGTYVFKEYNCPISQIAKEYPVACACEQELFQEILGTEEIECEACMAIDDVPHCFYKIKEPMNEQ
ncbi:helix-turn-helix transcriptional regulator [Desertibacillus haloalkaliphilus]|uniref:helix-turn-helix transcriptional regulator n=1 Tax=Desertibacillus haloalkaliphilus TaxID=1328930 RepID=UPI001C264D65|nr:metalloregulator ArsR/SmtB family transcription factor [Desertibacillus haloalkaliphilus]MBU8906567.1 transcriptional regulator [Desertibacillus haloalkaliphilus]